MKGERELRTFVAKYDKYVKDEEEKEAATMTSSDSMCFIKAASSDEVREAYKTSQDSLIRRVR